MRHTDVVRPRALVLGGLILALCAGAAVAYLSTRGHESAARPTPVSSAPEKHQSPLPRIRGPHNRPVPILMYHEIGPTPAGAAFPGLYVSRTEFTAQLRWLARQGYQPVSLRSVYLYWRGLRRLPKRPVVLTFDDGYRGHFTNAAPLLRARGWPAVLNLEYAHFVHGDLTGRMIRRLLADGWELDSHTLTHPDLTAVDAATLREEVFRSRVLLRKRFGVPVDFFCYPAGRFDSRVVRTVRAAGYLAATTTQPGLASPKSLFTLARIRVDSGDGPRGLARKLAAAGA